MLKRRTGVALVAVLLTTVSPTLPLAAQGSKASVCDADTRVANLNFTLRDLDGKSVTLSQYKGRVVVLNFWATWCGPCKIEIPGFVKLYQTYRGQGLVVLGVSIDDPVSKLKPFAERLKINYPVLVGNGREDLWKAYPMMGVPNTFIIGRDGKVCRQYTGLALEEQIEPEIKALL